MNGRPNQEFIGYAINENLTMKYFKVKNNHIEFGYSIYREETVLNHVTLVVRCKTET